jgi:plastocyanin
MRITSWRRSPIVEVLVLVAAITAAGLTVAGVSLWDVDPASTSSGQAVSVNGPMPPMADMPAASGQGSGDAPVATDTVRVENFAYAPATVTVKAGTTVTWTNQDQDPHTVTSTNGGPLRSQPLATGQSFRYTFTTPGRFDYLCTIHPFMTATVVVTP